MLVMANSKKLGGRCVAGFDLNALQWVRPTGASIGSPLWPLDTVVAANGQKRQVRPLDIVDFKPGRNTRTSSHPEDIELRGNFSHVRAINTLEMNVLLGSQIRTRGLPFDNEQEFWDSSALESKPVGRSLECWKVKRVQLIRKQQSNGGSGVWGRVTFDDHSVTYKVTDDDFIQRNPTLDHLRDVHLTFSIGEPFSPHGLPLRNYILIAAVIRT